MTRTSIQKKLITSPALIAACGLMVVGVGCENLPGSTEQQGAAGGGAAGAAAGAALADDNRALGAVIGGLLGAGGGYLAGSQLDKSEDEARDAAEEARRNPADVSAVDGTDSADLDDNGFVTMDELVAMKQAGLDGDEIVDRAENTDQVFRLDRQQERELRDAGYDLGTIDRLEQVNRDEVDRYERERSDRISSPA